MGLPLIGAGVNLLGGILGGIFGGEDRRKAKEAAERSVSLINELQLPPDQARAMMLKEFESAGVLTPELEQAIEMAPSEVAKTFSDKKLNDTQMRQLGALEQVASSGFRSEDRAQLAKIQQDFARDQQAKQQQIAQQAQMRGQGRAGADLASALLASQSGAEQASMEGLQVAGDASKRALQAYSQAGGLAGDIRQQGFGEATTRAGAQDQLNRAKAEAEIARQMRNVGSKNLAQSTNLSAKQNLMNMNTQQGNQELQRQRQAEQADYANRVNLAGMKSNAQQNLAGVYENQGNKTAQTFQGVGSAVGGGITAYDQNQQAQEAAKKAQEREDAYRQKLLDAYKGGK